jgi:hypothetical protein
MAQSTCLLERLASSRLFFLAGFRLVTLFFPLADGAKGRALESEFFS